MVKQKSIAEYQIAQNIQIADRPDKHCQRKPQVLPQQSIQILCGKDGDQADEGQPVCLVTAQDIL